MTGLHWMPGICNEKLVWMFVICNKDTHTVNQSLLKDSFTQLCSPFAARSRAQEYGSLIMGKQYRDSYHSVFAYDNLAQVMVWNKVSPTHGLLGAVPQTWCASKARASALACLSSQRMNTQRSI
jgi:hypothetical protein